MISASAGCVLMLQMESSANSSSKAFSGTGILYAGEKGCVSEKQVLTEKKK
jgi:hypothetical protein